MKFEKYEGIKNTDNEVTYDKFFREGYFSPSVKWCVTEKVHGSHMDIAYDGNKIEFWSRNRNLPEEENFYNYHRIREGLKALIKRAYRIIRQDTHCNDFELLVCGELFGGSYPHKDVEDVPSIKGVQDKLYYHPDLRFYAFDIKINGDFLNYYAVVNILRRAGFLVAEILCEGSFEECMKYPNDFQTKIPEYFELPEIEGNIAEGVVLKPIVPKTCLDGSRVIFKNKNKKFDERNKEPKQPKKPMILTEKAQKVFDIITTYVTENRLDSVMSKINPETLDKKTGFGHIMGMFQRDIMESLKDDNGNLMNTLEKRDKHIIHKFLGKECVPLVKKVWMQILE